MTTNISALIAKFSEAISNKSKWEKLTIGLASFILAGMALFSFEKAIFTPIMNTVILYLGDQWLSYVLILIASSIILVYVLGKRLPFTKKG